MELTFFNSHFLSLFCEDGCKEPSGTILRATSAKSNLVMLKLSHYDENPIGDHLWLSDHNVITST